MTPLNVPFSEKDAAKALGAKWSGESRTWYVPTGVNPEPFARWFIVERPLVELYVDLVPRSAWFSNLRSELMPIEWEALKRNVYKKADYRCEACGGKGPDHPVECHERWTYDDETGVQKLTSLVAFCPDCHQATHIGSARVKGRFEEAKAHLMTVNKWTAEIAAEHIDAAFSVWLRRSEMSWALDATWLLGCGIDLCDVTRQKIVDHAQQLRERHIETWQDEVRARHAPGASPLAHYFAEHY